MVTIHNQMMDCMSKSHKQRMITPVTTMRITVLQKWKKVTSPPAKEFQRKHIHVSKYRNAFWLPH